MVVKGNCGPGFGSLIGQDDFEGTLQGAGGANQFAIRAPPAVINMHDGNLATLNHQCAAPANRYTQSATIAF